MLSPSEVESLSRLLERQERLVTVYNDARAVPAAAGFIRFLSAQPALAVLLNELIEEAQAARQSHVREAATILAALSALCGEHGLEFTNTELDITGAKDAPFSEIVRELRDPTSPQRAWQACNQFEGVLDSFIDEVREHREAAGSDQPESLKQAGKSLARLHRVYRCLRLKMATSAEVVPGEAYLSLSEHVRSLVPPLLADPSGRGVVFGPHLENAMTLRKEIQEAWRFPPREHGVMEHEVSALVRRLSVALQTKLAQRQSLQGLIKRFAARCESFEAGRIRATAAKSKGTVEAGLALEFARFLHVEHYNPVLNPDVSGLKPDIVHIDNGPALYVEVKQFAQVTKRQVQRAVAQVRDTWQKFANRFDTPEAVLLIFRMGGRNLDLPDELPTARGRLLIHVVNVAPAKVSGSRAMAPLKLSIEDLLQEQTSDG